MVLPNDKPLWLVEATLHVSVYVHADTEEDAESLARDMVYRIGMEVKYWKIDNVKLIHKLMGKEGDDEEVI